MSDSPIEWSVTTISSPPAVVEVCVIGGGYDLRLRLLDISTDELGSSWSIPSMAYHES